MLVSFSSMTYSQSSRFNYSSTIERVRDEKDAGKFNDIANTSKKINSTVIINEAKKTITISRKYISKSGESIDEFENYDFVKKEKADGDSVHYYCIDLANKKYVEFLIGVQKAKILENCDGFNGCQKVIELAN